MGRYRLTGDSVTDLETAPSAVFGEVDLDNDRMYIIVAPGSSPAEMLAVRKLIKVCLYVYPAPFSSLPIHSSSSK